jgi:putative heme-binding domain-containing protein
MPNLVGDRDKDLWRVVMPNPRVFLPGLLVVVLFTVGPDVVRAQKPAPVENVSTLPHRTPAEERKALHVPPGFEIQLVAAEPDIHKPLNLAFDDLGRLWVTDTVEYPFPKPEGTPGRDTVKILSDFGPDGRAGKIQTFADGLNIPIGLLPYPSGREAIVHNIPNIYLMKDSDGDGRADVRQVLYGIIGHRDTHGMTNAFSWGFDGWIYACHGFANESKVQGSDHRPIQMNSGNTYRFKPDGSHAEYITHGQVNPFGLAFDPLGNLYSSDCHSRPVYQLLRGAWYPSFGKPDDGLGFGPEMVTHDHGSTGIAGIVYYAADQFPEAFRDNVFIGNVVTNRINRDRIEWHGSTPKGIEQPDLVWSEDNWFRPVDIELGPDGALYVADFYNRIIGHYEVDLRHPGRDRTSGRIWRIVYRGAEGKQPPAPLMVDRTKSSVNDLIVDLGHPNLVVRMTAANQLVERAAKGEDVVAAVRSIMRHETPARQRVHGLWVLQRLEAFDEDIWRNCATDPDRELRVHQLKTLIERTVFSNSTKALATRALEDPDAFVRRAAAEALGARPALTNIRPLLALRQKTPADDNHLIHVARMALRDQLKTTGTWEWLDTPGLKRDQLKSPRTWEWLDTLGLTERDRRDIADVALGVPSADSAAYLLAYLQKINETPGNWLRFVHHIARYGAPDQMGGLTDLVGHASQHDDRVQAGLIKAMHQGFQERGTPPSAEMHRLAVTHARSLLGSGDAGKIDLGIELASGLQLKETQETLREVALRTATASAHRSAAMTALMAINAAGNDALVASVLRDPAEPIELREAGAGLLAASSNAVDRAVLAELLPLAPGRLQTAIAAGLARRRDGAEALLDAIAAGKASARLLQEQRVAVALKGANPPKLDERMRSLLAGLPPADQKLSALMDRRRAGFRATSHRPEAGAPVFEKNCAICHQLGGKGAKVGPQLDGIGSRGLDRLVEDILDPNRNVDQTFRVTVLALKDGRVVSGLLLREEGEVLILADAQGKDVRVPRSSVEERQTSPLSPMPANLAEQIAEDDFDRLLAYLLSRREPTNPPPAPK